jgi:uncharacterized protein
MKKHPVTPLTERDLTALGEVFQRYPEVTAIYLFGSMATGRIHPESDLDLAIVPRDAGARRLKLAMLTDLARSGYDDVSLVFLDTTDIVLKYEAVRHNRLIYSIEDFDRGAFYSKVVLEYLDFEPYLRVQREAYKRRILRGSPGSLAQTTEQTR